MVEDGATTVNVDQQVMNWIKDSKEWLDAGYLNKTVKGQWNDDWNKAMDLNPKYLHSSSRHGELTLH